jgi:hypothetical protein
VYSLKALIIGDDNKVELVGAGRMTAGSRARTGRSRSFPTSRLNALVSP